MGEVDAWWFDNLWLNIQQVENPHQRALAYYHALGVSDYVHSFTPETADLRRPLSEVFEDLWRGQRKVQNNEKDNRSFNLEATEFVGTARTDLLYAHFPHPDGLAAQRDSLLGWRETWIRGSATGFDELLAQVNGFGDRIASKGRYLDLIGKFLENAKHIPRWAIAHPEDGFITAAELGELIKTFRPVEVTYAKDFSEVSGGLNTYIIVA